MVELIMTILGLTLIGGYLFLLLRWVYCLPRAWRNRFFAQGMRRLHQGKYKTAIAKFTKAIQHQPENFDAYLGRSHAYIRMNELDKALADCDTVIRLQPTNHFAFLNRGAIYGLKEDYPRSLADTTQCLELQPEYQDALFNRACTFSRLGNTEEALVDFSKAILLSPSKIDNYIERGNLFFDTQQYSKAIEDFTQAMKLGDSTAELLTCRGYAYLKMELFEKAIADYELAIEIDPHARPALNNLAWLLATCPAPEFRDGNRALALALHNCELTEDTDWYDEGTLAAAYAETGQFEEAIRWIKLATTKAPELEKPACEARLKCYESLQPYRDSPLKTSSDEQ
ncbi:MAG: tetratricopeptide repeat protein [Planctomycetota bacterium]